MKYKKYTTDFIAGGVKYNYLLSLEYEKNKLPIAYC